uniref:Iron uptake protein FhuD n=1 Tax=Campylobacter jejuni TaxID=197 RepID=Q9F0F7_CAMJU|nr:iron uptake protein FhuD [Campylobacter jejuni]
MACVCWAFIVPANACWRRRCWARPCWPRLTCSGACCWRRWTSRWESPRPPSVRRCSCCCSAVSISVTKGASAVAMRLVCCLLLVCLAQGAWATDAQLVARQSAGVGEAPQRIVSLDELSTELLVSLGIEPVGVANLANYRRYIGIGNDLLERSVALGGAQQPNLEAIARLEPDLIVGVAYLHLPLFERLDGLAPTLIYQVSLASAGYDGVAIGEAMLAHLGRLTGRQAQAAAVIREGQQALDAARQSVREQHLQGEPVAVLYPLVQQGSFIALNQQTLIGSLMNRLEVRSPWTLRSAHSLHRRIDMRSFAARRDCAYCSSVGRHRRHSSPAPCGRRCRSLSSSVTPFFPRGTGPLVARVRRLLSRPRCVRRSRR